MATKSLCAIIALLLDIKSASSATILTFGQSPPSVVINNPPGTNGQYVDPITQNVPNGQAPQFIPPELQPLYQQMHAYAQQYGPQIAPQVQAVLPQSVIYGSPPPDAPANNMHVTLPSVPGGSSVTFVYNPPATAGQQPPPLSPPANPYLSPPPEPPLTPPLNPSGQTPVVQPPPVLGAGQQPPPEPPITPPVDPSASLPEQPPILQPPQRPIPPPVTPDVAAPQTPPELPANPDVSSPPPQRPEPPSQPQPQPQLQAQVPVINAAAAAAENKGEVVDTQKVDIKTIASGQQHEMDDINLTLSQQSQIMIALLMAFFFGCTMMRCCCNSKTKRYGDYMEDAQFQQRGGGNGSVQADIDWSDNTEDEEDPEEPQQAPTAFPFKVRQRGKNEKKAKNRGFEHVADESRDDRLASMEVMEEADIQILMEEDAVRQEEEDEEQEMEEEDSHYKQYARRLRRRFMGRSPADDTDDETRAIMREFKDSDDEYVD